MRLLYAEDNRLNALLFEEIVRELAHIELRIAENGAEALRLAREWQPEVLVLDANLPDTTGFDLLPQLRALPGLAEAPAFLCSADEMPQRPAPAGTAGFDGYWSKPIDVNALMATLDSLVRDHARR